MFHLLLTTIEKKIFEGKVHALITQGTLGYFEVLTHHAPLITPIKSGKLVITKENYEKLFLDISGGIFEVSNNRCTILADSVEVSKDRESPI